MTNPHTDSLAGQLCRLAELHSPEEFNIDVSRRACIVAADLFVHLRANHPHAGCDSLHDQWLELIDCWIENAGYHGHAKHDTSRWLRELMEMSAVAGTVWQYLWNHRGDIAAVPELG